MATENSKRDANRVTSLTGVTDDSNAEVRNLLVDASTGRLLVSGTFAGGSGDVVGPSSATDNAVARFDGATGKLIQNSGVIIDDSNNISGLGTINSKTIPTGAFVGTTDTQTLTNKTIDDSLQFTYVVTPSAPPASTGRLYFKADLYPYFQTASSATEYQFVTTNTTQTLSLKTLTAPKIASGGFIADANGNEQIIFTTTASAVNEITFANAATGNNPTFTASGGDGNVGINFQVKGTGVYRFLATASGPTDIRLFEDTDNGTNYVSLIAPASMASDRVLTLPDATDTLVGKATTDTLTNKTYDTAGSGNSFLINGLAATANTGTGSVVRATSPTLVTPALGVATATSINSLTISTSTGTLTITNGKTLSVSNTLTLAGTDSTTITFQGTDTYVGRTTTDTLTNKTLTAPIISTISNTGTLTLPTSTDTLVGRATTDTLTNKTLTAPKFADLGFIADANGNELIILDTVASAVNEITFANAATGSNPKFSATGGDSNVGIDFQTKGTGTYRLLGTSNQAAELRLYEDTDDGTNYTAFKVGTQSADVTYTLPTAVPASNGQVLSSTTGGVMSWATASANKISCIYTDVSVTNTATETSLISLTITGGTLSTNNAVRVKMNFSSITTNGSDTLTLRFKYGATTMISETITIGASKTGTIEYTLLATGATGTQEAFEHIFLCAAGTTANTGLSQVFATSTGTASEDSTADKTLAVTAQWSSNDASDNITLASAIIEKIS